MQTSSVKSTEPNQQEAIHPDTPPETPPETAPETVVKTAETAETVVKGM